MSSGSRGESGWPGRPSTTLPRSDTPAQKGFPGWMSFSLTSTLSHLRLRSTGTQSAWLHWEDSTQKRQREAELVLVGVGRSLTPGPATANQVRRCKQQLQRCSSLHLHLSTVSGLHPGQATPGPPVAGACTVDPSQAMEEHELTFCLVAGSADQDSSSSSSGSGGDVLAVSDAPEVQGVQAAGQLAHELRDHPHGRRDGDLLLASSLPGLALCLLQLPAHTELRVSKWPAARRLGNTSSSCQSARLPLAV